MIDLFDADICANLKPRNICMHSAEYEHRFIFKNDRDIITRRYVSDTMRGMQLEAAKAGLIGKTLNIITSGSNVGKSVLLTPEENRAKMIRKIHLNACY